jgi:branched-chain amino acid transport system substrate-binding protein
VHCIVRSLILRLSCLALTQIISEKENDAFGLSGLDGLTRSLSAQGLAVYSKGGYAANSVDIDAAYNSIFSVVDSRDNTTRPQVICLFSLSKASVALMARARSDPRYDPDTIWIVQSIIGPEDFYNDLRNDPVIQGNFTNIYAIQVLPSPQSRSSRLVRRYQAAMDDLFPGGAYTYNSLEGYLNGRFLIYTLSRTGANITRDTLLDAIWATETFQIEDILIGPFTEAGASQCNQGSKYVYFSQLFPNGSYVDVPSGYFSWESTCQSSTAALLQPVIVGQSAALTGSSSLLGVPYTVGLKTSINRFNRLGGKESRIVKLISMDDGYQATRSTENTKQLLKLNPVGLVGWSGSAVSQAALALSIPAHVPFFAPFSGAVQGLRSPCSKYAIHVRPSYYDETAAMVDYLWKVRGFRRISVFYQNDAFGISGLNGTKLALGVLGSDIVSEGHHERNFNVTDEGVRNTTIGEPQAVVVFCIYFSAAQYISRAMKDPTLKNATFIAPSVVNTDAFINWMTYEGINTQINERVWVTQVFPNPRDRGFDVVREYQDELVAQGTDPTPTYLGLEGYIAGRFVTGAIDLIPGAPSAEALTDIIYQYPIFNIDGFRIGPYELDTNISVSSSRANTELRNITACRCNQGGHQIYLTKLLWNETASRVEILNDAALDYFFETCGIIHIIERVDEVSVGLRAVILAFAALCSVIVVLAMIGVIIYRDTKSITSSSPVFLLLVLGGALLLSISPWFALPWNKSGKFYSDLEIAFNNNICMAWIWFLGLGFVMFFAPLVVKTWRVHRIFNNRVLSRIIVIKNTELGLLVLVLVTIEVVFLIVWTVVSGSTFTKLRAPGTVDVAIYICSGQYDTIFAGIQGGYMGALAFAGLIFAFLTRNIKYGSFKESSEIVLCVYLFTFVGIILGGIGAALYYSPPVSAVIKGLGVIFVTITSIFVLFGMKFYRIITRTEKMSTGSGPHGRSFNSGTLGTNSWSSGSGSPSSGSTRSSSGTTNSTTDSSDLSSPSTSKTSGSKNSDRSPQPKKKSVAKAAPKRPAKDESEETESSSEDEADKKKAKKTKSEKESKKESKKDSKKDSKPKKSDTSKSTKKAPAPQPKKPEVLPESSDETEPSSEDDRELELPVKKPASPKPKESEEVKAKSPASPKSPKSPKAAPKEDESMETEESSSSSSSEEAPKKKKHAKKD